MWIFMLAIVVILVFLCLVSSCGRASRRSSLPVGITSVRRLRLIGDKNDTFAVIIVTLCLFDAVIVWLLLAK